MGDQRIVGEPRAASLKGRTVWLTRGWTCEDDEDWPDAAAWIKEQYERLRFILEEPTGEERAES